VQFEYVNDPIWGRFYIPLVGATRLQVGDLAPTENNPVLGYRGVFPNQAFWSFGAQGTGIYCCAQSCAHELQHQWNYVNDTGYDTDGDGLSDDVEAALWPGYDWLTPDTWHLADIDPQYASYGDEECTAREAEKEPGSVVPSADWSVGGENWH